MSNTKKILASVLFLAIAAPACGPGTATPEARINATQNIPQSKTQFQFEKSAIWPAAEVGACARLKEIYAEPSHRRSRFSFLARPFSYSVTDGGEVNAVGGLDLSKSPLMQFVLTTPAIDERVTEVLAKSDEEFLKLARERLKVDACEAEPEPKSALCVDNIRQWKGANAMFRDGTLGKEKAVAVGRELARRFPGIFGDAGAMEPGKEGSIFLSLLDRVGLFASSDAANEVHPEDAESILTVEVPLFSESRTWAAWLADARRTMPSAVAGISAQPSKAERLCSLVLWQRTFAQMLMIKGYEGPKLTSAGRLPAIPEGASALEKTRVSGAYLERDRGGAAVILEPEEIPNYDPVQRYLEGAARTPLLRDPEVPRAGSLSDALDRLEALSWVFAATSPAAWGDSSTYFFGDLVETSTAIAPFQTHTLALGLMIMDLKNLGENYIVPVDSENDNVLTNGNGTGMVLLAGGKQSTRAGEMRLAELAKLTNTVVRLSDGLEKVYAMAERNSRLLETRSLVYSKEHKEGEPFYTAAKLKDLETLRALLNRLMYPLAHRMIRMTEAAEGCVARETANWEAGGKLTRRTLERCTEAHVREYKASMRILAHHTGSKVWYRKSL